MPRDRGQPFTPPNTINAPQARTCGSYSMNAPQPAPAVSTPARHFIGNRWVAAERGETLPMIDPSDGKPFAAIARGSEPDIDRAVLSAEAARDGAWGKLAPAEKG